MRVIQTLLTERGPRTIVSSGLSATAAGTIMHASIASGGMAHVADDEPGVNLAAIIRGSEVERKKALRVLKHRAEREAERAAEVAAMESAMQESHGRVVNLALLPAA